VYIHRSTILIILTLLLMAPILRDWILSGGTEWYRFFLAWLFVIVLVAWNQRLIRRREPNNAE